MFDKKELEDIKKNLKKYTPEILDVAILQAHLRDCIDNTKPFFENMPEPTRERIKKLLKDKEEG